MSLTTIMNQLSSMSIEELRTLNESVVHTIKFKRKQKGNAVKGNLSVGQKVQFPGKGGEVLFGVLIEKNRTRGVVSVDYHGGRSENWRVPFSMITPRE